MASSIMYNCTRRGRIGFAVAMCGIFALASAGENAPSSAAANLTTPTVPSNSSNDSAPLIVGRDVIIKEFVVSNSSESNNQSLASPSPASDSPNQSNGSSSGRAKEVVFYVLDSEGGRVEKHKVPSSLSAKESRVRIARQLAGNPGTLNNETRITSDKDGRAVFGNDDRTIVDPIVNPYTKIGRLTITKGNIKQICTASLVYSNIILTNAHCVVDDSFQVPSDFLDKADFTLGLSGTSFLEISDIDKVWVAEEYTSKKGCPNACSFADDDWAILRLTKPLGETFGWFGVLEFSPATVNSCNACRNGMELAGYSADQACNQGNSLCTHKTCSIVGKATFNKLNLENIKNHFVSYAVHDCDSQGGSSGSAVFNFVTEQIYALHAQSASDGSPNPTFSQSPTKNNLFPGNLAIPSDVWFSALETIVNEESGNNTTNTCSTSNPGESGYCTESCRCNQGEGDCQRNNAYCNGALVCVEDIGSVFGFSSSTDVCVSACSELNPDSPSSCDFPSSDIYEEEDDDKENIFDFNPFDASIPFAKTTTAQVLVPIVLVLIGFHTLFL